MIITDPSLKPSERLLIVLNEFFGKEGYELTKSNKTFSREFENGIERVQVEFYSTIALVDASLEFSKSFLLIEKVHSSIFGNGKKYKNEKTVFSNLMNWYMNTGIKDIDYKYPIFNQSSNDFEDLYTDSTINDAANFLYNSYKQTIVPIFNSIQTIQDLDDLFNKDPKSYCNLMGWDDKRNQLAYIVNHITQSKDKTTLRSELISRLRFDVDKAQSEFDKIDVFFHTNDYQNLKY